MAAQTIRQGGIGAPGGNYAYFLVTYDDVSFRISTVETHNESPTLTLRVIFTNPAKAPIQQDTAPQTVNTFTATPVQDYFISDDQYGYTMRFLAA